MQWCKEIIRPGRHFDSARPVGSVGKRHETVSNSAIHRRRILYRVVRGDEEQKHVHFFPG